MTLDKNTFEIGQKVICDLDYDGKHLVSGIVGGIGFEHVITMYIVVFDEPLDTGLEKVKGWTAAVLSASQMKAVE